jgi:hypothetical protein
MFDTEFKKYETTKDIEDARIILNSILTSDYPEFLIPASQRLNRINPQFLREYKKSYPEEYDNFCSSVV